MSSKENNLPGEGKTITTRSVEQEMIVTPPVDNPVVVIPVNPSDYGKNNVFYETGTVYVLPPGMVPGPNPGQIIHYDPENLHFVSNATIILTQQKINDLIGQARAEYPQDTEVIKSGAQSALSNIRQDSIFSVAEVSSAADALQTAVNTLQANIDIKNQIEQEVNYKALEAEKGFDNFLNHKEIRLSGFKNKRPDILDVAISLSPVKKRTIELWNELYLSKRQAEIEARNRLVTALKQVKTSVAEVTDKASALQTIKAQSIKEKRRAEEKARIEAERKAWDEQQAKEKAKAEAVAKARQEAIDKARADMLAEKEKVKAKEAARKEALWSVGLALPMVIGPEKARSVEIAMARGGTLIFNRFGQGGLQLSLDGLGTMLTDSAATKRISAAIEMGVQTLLRYPVAAGVAGTIVGLFWPSELGTATHEVTLDTAALFAIPAELLAGKGAIQPGMKTVDMPVRGALVVDNGHLALKLLRTGSAALPRTVQILETVHDVETEMGIITVPAKAGWPARKVLVNPWPEPEKKTAAPAAPAMPAPVLPGIPGFEIHNPGLVEVPPSVAFPATPVHTGTEIKPVENSEITTTPVAEDDIQDFIYWRLDASGTGVEPVYIMLSDPRNLPGIATGNGEPVGEGWLNKAGEEPGVPIPSQIADKLRGRKFVDFRTFRHEFWLEVGKDPELVKQFIDNNKLNLKKGYSPFPPKPEHVGGRKRYELHHIKFISKGGAVYDIDNIRVTTPRRHIEMHNEEK